MKQDDLLKLFGSAASLAREIDVHETTVRNWFGRNSIPAKHDAAIIAAAERRDGTVTPMDLHSIRQELAARKSEGAAA